MKKAFKTFMSSLGVSVLWIIFTLLIRPAVLAIELATVVAGFFADIITFPIDFMKFEEKESQR